MLRRISILLSLFLFGCTTGPIQIEHVRVYNKPENDFKHISEYFSGEESDHGYRLVLRTNPDIRAGLYFAVSFSQSLASLPNGSSAELDLIFERQDDTRTFHFPLPDNRSDKTVLYLGLTNPEEPKSGSQIMAWRVRIIDSDKKVLLKKDSYLWEMPSNKQ